jgi:hypothetical protein
VSKILAKDNNAYPSFASLTTPRLRRPINETALPLINNKQPTQGRLKRWFIRNGVKTPFPALLGLFMEIGFLGGKDCFSVLNPKH